MGYLGLQAVTEKDGSGEKLDSVEGVFGAAYSMWRFDTPELDLELDFTLYPGITESDRLRANTDLRLSWELVEDLFWDITGWASYDDASQSGSDTITALPPESAGSTESQYRRWTSLAVCTSSWGRESGNICLAWILFFITNGMLQTGRNQLPRVAVVGHLIATRVELLHIRVIECFL